MASFYGINSTGKHEVSIYRDNYADVYSIYYDNEFWCNCNALREFEIEIRFIEKSFKVKFWFYGF